jgi:hypothetical protein
MRRRLRISGVILFTALLMVSFALTACGGDNETPSPQGTGTLQGVVRDAVTQNPLANATVSVQGTSLQGISNTQGQYEIQNVPSGTQTAIATATGYTLQSQSVSITVGATTQADFLLTASNVLVNQTVSVGAGGGFGVVSFNASNGQKIRITLTVSNTSMEPYGFFGLLGGGSGSYIPPQDTVHDGVNTADVTLNETGTYELTIYDGSNQGGTVSVLIEVI